MKYFLGGVNGAGKTTLLANINKYYPEFKTLKGSHVFMEYLGIDQGDYESLRKFPHDLGMKKLEKFMLQLTTNFTDLVLDSHFMNLVRGESKVVVSDWIENFDAVLLIDVPSNVALQRSENEARDRALFPEGMSRVEQEKMYDEYILDYKKVFEDLSQKYNVPGKILDGTKEPREILQDFINFDSELKNN